MVFTTCNESRAQTTVDIHAIQTDLPSSPYLGQSVTTAGIVIGVLSDGFYVENPESDWDDSISTAEGIYIYTPSGVPSNAVVGNRLQVTGTVEASNTSPYAGTQILISSTPSTLSTGNPLPGTVPSNALGNAATGVFGQWLEFEGMRIEVSSLLTVSGTSGTITESSQTAVSNGQFWGVLSGTSRPFRASGISELDTVPSTAPSTVARWSGNPQLLFVDSAIRGGPALDVTANETIVDLIGIVDYHESSAGYTGILLDPSNGYGAVTGSSTATAAASPASGQVTVATQDLSDFYDTSTISTSAFNRRIAKTALAIANYESSPDILAVQNVESLTALTALASQISADGGASYTPYWFAGNDSSGLTNGLLVNPAKIDVLTIEQSGKDAVYTNIGGTAESLFAHPPLVLHAGIQRSGTTDYDVTVVDANLLDRTNIDSTTSGAAVRAQREAQAVYLADLIQTYEAAGEHVIAAGNYNSFEYSDGYVDTVGAIDGSPVASSLVTLASPSGLTSPNLVNLTTTAASTSRYSYVEEGSAEEPDHILVTSDLSSLATIDYARFGADFPLADLNDAATPLHASDHDAVIAYITVPYPTTLTLTSSLNPSYYRDSVTFTATATSSSGTPTGTVTFYDGSTELGASTLDSGTATYATATLAVGSHAIKAVYGGDSSHESTTASLTQVVEALLSTSNTLSCTPNPAAYGSTVTCTDTVSGSSTTPTGTVTFYDGTTALGEATLSAGIASYSTSSLTVGTHTLTAVYEGAAPYAASTSNTVNEIITSSFSLSISPSSASVYTGEAASYTVTVSPDTGFTLDVSLTCSGLPTNTTCSLSPTTLTGGSGTSKVVVQTTAPAKTAASGLAMRVGRIYFLSLSALVFAARTIRRRGSRLMPLMLLALGLSTFLNGCSSSGSLNGGTPTGTYTITVTGNATDGSITITKNATTSLTVKSLF